MNREDMLKQLLPILSAIIALFAYGASGATTESQNKLFGEFLNVQREMADFRGELRFRATYDESWNVTLERIDGEAFSLVNLTLTPSFQRSPTTGPETGESVILDPLRFYDIQQHVVRIPKADEEACAEEVTDLCQQMLERIFLDFEFGGNRHRVVTYQREN